MSIFPFIDAQTSGSGTKNNSKELPIYREYAYDYEKNELLKNKEGKHYLIEKNEAIRVWIYKALQIPRFRFCAYSADLGTEIEDNMIGKSLSEDVLTAELRRYIIEALMVNPYIKELSDFLFEKANTGMKISFTAATIYGKEEFSFFVKGGE